MKQNKKTLKIKNKKLILEEDDTYGDALSDMTTGLVGDVAKFAKDSAKFWGNMATFLGKNSWLVIRYKVLGNISEEEFIDGIKNVRIDFVDSTDRNIDSIDSNVGNMLSKAGISDKEINSYLLGLPGYNIIENINASNILTGRTFRKARYSKIDPLSFDALEFLIFWMLASTDSDLKDTDSITNEKVKSTLTKNIKKVAKLKILIPKELRKVMLGNAIDILNSIKNKKSKKLLDQIKTLSSTTYRASNIETKRQAEKFIKELKNRLSRIKDKNSSKEESLFIKLDGVDLKLISEVGDYNVDEFNSIYTQIIESLAFSLIFVSQDIQEIVLKDFYSELNNAIKKDVAEGIISDTDDNDVQISNNLNALHKNIAVCAFNMHYFSAELKFIDEIVEKSKSTEIKLQLLQTSLANTYKKEIGTEAKEFKPIATDLRNFVTSRSKSDAFTAYKNQINQLKEDKKKEQQGDTKVENELLDDKYKVLYSIGVCTFADSYYDFLKKEYEEERRNGSVENIKEYFKVILEDKINKSYLPKEIISLLQKLKNVEESDIATKMADVKNNIDNRKNDTDVELEKIKEKIESNKQEISTGSESSSSDTETQT